LTITTWDRIKDRKSGDTITWSSKLIDEQVKRARLGKYDEIPGGYGQHYHQKFINFLRSNKVRLSASIAPSMEASTRG
jgi:hypothetical protein